MSFSNSQLIFDSQQMAIHINRLADEILSLGWDDFILVGIVTGGAVLAEVMADSIAHKNGRRPEVYKIDITLYRDDLYTGFEKLSLGESELPLSINGVNIILVDDVLFTGRTVRAALQVIYDYGRPNCIRLLTLIDRGHRELPIQADFIGACISSNKTDKVVVEVYQNNEKEDSVFLLPIQTK